ncbi:hypothetical protein C5167_007973 [Papaver somniferum]|uniref:Legume lectin domain-containing protein n=1 Tax=Papaver somniferum TaxID=3469 RepID=A0A4Y7JWD1_PAPSO|nr:hypothetical protein C5167_007973 [Papaver somniferum]
MRVDYGLNVARSEDLAGLDGYNLGRNDLRRAGLKNLMWWFWMMGITVEMGWFLSFHVMPESIAMSFYKNFCNSFFILLFFLIPTMNSISFNMPRFEYQASDIILEGDAVASMGTVEMINKKIYGSRVGRASYAKPVPLWDSATRELTHFTTHFMFSIQKPTPFYGDGLAFFIAPVGCPIPPNSAGGFLGLFNTTTTDKTSLNQIIHVEFDSFLNEEWDPDSTHVGMNNNSIESSVSSFWNASLYSGETGNAWITYDATTNHLLLIASGILRIIFVCGANRHLLDGLFSENLCLFGMTDISLISLLISPFQSIATVITLVKVDLKEVLPQNIKVGFSASSGFVIGRHTLLSWGFNSSLVVKSNIKLVVALSVSAVFICGVAVAVVLLILTKKTKGKMTVNLKQELFQKASLTKI